MKRTIIRSLQLSLLFVCIIQTLQGSSITSIYNPINYGAKGDGSTLDTKAIQQAIDECHQNGGGKVYLQNGCFVSGTIYMKDNVYLEIEAGATLRASNNLEDFPIIPSRYYSYKGPKVTNKMLIYAEDVKNITICGMGTIDGNGDHWIDGPYGSPSFSLRPRIIHLRGCENVNIRDVTLYNSASWVQSYQLCKNLYIDGITVDSRENKDIEKMRFADARGRNNDGLDLVDCEIVRISNCYINCGDDAIVLKSFAPDKICRDIVITNCIVSSNASGIKIGTETSGGFEDITIQNCVIYDTRGDGISVSTVDGARIERINIANITMRNIKGSSIFIRLNSRNTIYEANANAKKGILKDVIIENIMGKRISSDYGSSITGIPGAHVENVSIKNVILEFEGGGTLEDAAIIVPEKEEGYPNGKMFSKLPAYGFFIRHVKNIILTDVQLRFTRKELRPAVICDEVEQLEINGLIADVTMKTQELIRLIDTRDCIISRSRPMSPVPVFLSVYGDASENIILQNNFLKNVKEKVASGKNSVIMESGTIR